MNEAAPEPSIGARLVRGSLWMIGMRWTLRFLGVLSTAAVARLLAPDDFGIMAMATMVLAFVEVFGEVGLDLALIRHPNPAPSHYNTAWTLQLLFGLAIGTVIFVLSPFAAEYFHSDRVAEVLRVIAFLPVIRGLENVGVSTFRRSLDFQKDFIYNAVSRLASVVVTIALALVLRNYWALALGMVTGVLIQVAVSYILHPFRPSPSLSEARELWSFSFWIMLRSLAAVVARKVDQFAIGRFAGSSGLGVYYMAAELAAPLTSDVVHPIGRAMMPGYARMLGEEQRTRHVFARVLGVVASLSCALGFGLAAVADDLVAVLLGDQWRESSDILRVLAVGAVAQAIATTAGPLLTAHNRVKPLATVLWMQLLALVITIFFVVNEFTLIGLAVVMVVADWVFLPVYLHLALRTVGGNLLDAMYVLGRPMLAGLAMLLILTTWSPDTGWPALDLARTVVFGGIIYTGVLLVAWYLGGNEEAPEADAIRRLKLLFRRGEEKRAG